MPPQSRDSLRAPLSAALRSSLTAGNAERAIKRANGFDRFAAYAAAHNVDPTLRDLRDPVPFLLTYAQQYRTGVLAPKGKPVRARTPEEAIRFVRQTIEFLAQQDPGRNAHTGEINKRLSNLWKNWTQEDPPPDRVKPVPMAVLHRAQHIAT